MIYHENPIANFSRLYDFLVKMDNGMFPPLSERICIRDYAEKLSRYADIFYVQDGEIDCGHCAIYMNQKMEGYISSFGVLPEYQGMGIGHLLMNNVLQKAVEKDIKKVSLEVHKDNKKALELYGSAGFKKVDNKGKVLKMIKDLDI